MKQLEPTGRAAAYFRCAGGHAAADPVRARGRYDDALREDPRLLRARIGRALLRAGPGAIDTVLGLRARLRRLLGG